MSLETNSELICPSCKAGARLSNHLEVYGKVYGTGGNIWVCENFPECRTYVGCHPGTKKAKGSMAGEELRKARMAAHGAFDKLWKVDGLKRKWAYSRLAKFFNEAEVHIGESGLEKCSQIVEWAKTQKLKEP